MDFERPALQGEGAGESIFSSLGMPEPNTAPAPAAATPAPVVAPPVAAPAIEQPTTTITNETLAPTPIVRPPAAAPEQIVQPPVAAAAPARASKQSDIFKELGLPAPDNSVGVTDFAKSAAAGAASGLGMIAQGGGELLARGINKVGETLGFDPKLRAVNPLQGWINDLMDSRTPGAKRAEAESQISGELLKPDTWSFGSNPTISGIALQGMNAIGQFAPNLAIALVTAGASVPVQLTTGALVGGIQALGGSLDEERETIGKMSHADLMAGSKLYAQLIAHGVPRGQAKEAVGEAAAIGGGLGNAIPSAAEGAFENFLIGALTRGKLKVPALFGAGKAGQIATGVLGGAATGGAEEAIEQVGQNIGSNVAIGGNRSLGEGTLQQFIMGALAEGAAGGGAGVISKGPVATASAAAQPTVTPAAGQPGATGSSQPAGGESAVSAEPKGPMAQAADIATTTGLSPHHAEPFFPFTEQGAQRRVGFLNRQGQASRVSPHPEHEGRFAIIPDEYGAAADDNAKIKALESEGNALIERLPKGRLMPAVQTRIREIDAEIEKMKSDAAVRTEKADKEKTDQAKKKEADEKIAKDAVAAEKKKAGELAAMDAQRLREEEAGRNREQSDVVTAHLTTARVAGMEHNDEPNAMQLALQSALKKKGATAVPTVDEAAHAAASSPQNALAHPTGPQIGANNAKLGHPTVGPFNISIENPATSVREDKHNVPPKWSRKMVDHYGYYKGVPARAPDKEHVDAFVKVGTPVDHTGPVFIIDQNNGNGQFDEPKAMNGYASRDEAVKAYLAHYDDGQESRIRGVTEVSTEEMQRRLNDPKAFLQPQSDARPLESKAVTAYPSKSAAQKLARPEKTESGPAAETVAEAPAKAGVSVSAPLELAGQTEKQIADAEADKKRATEEKAAAEKKAEDKRKADSEREDFALSGSDRPADVAASGGQADLLAAPANPMSTVASALRTAADAIDEAVTPKKESATPASGLTVAPSKEGAKAPAAADSIDDFGEKIGGARKDTAQPTGTRLQEAAEESAEPGWRKRFTVAQIASSRNANEVGQWVVHDERKKDFRGQARQVGNPFATKEAAEQAIPLMAVAQKHHVVPGATKDGITPYTIWRYVTDRKRVQVVKEQFTTRDDAMRYMAQHAVDIIETKTAYGEEILARPDKVMRKGTERRSAPATPPMFMDTFGFRGVEFGKWNNQDERQEVMNHAYDGLRDLAEVLKVPPKALSLNGELALAFGARGQGLSSARAHYERDYGVINLTKMAGAGTLAHEWFHATDHYFARQDTKAKSEKIKNERGDLVYPASTPRLDYASHGFRSANSQVRPELRAAYTDLIQTMFTKAEQYVEDTQKAEKFVGSARERLAEALNGIREALLRGPEQLHYMKRNNKPASAEQMATFEQLADKLVSGEDLVTQYRPSQESAGKKIGAPGWMAGRQTNDTLEGISAILKAVRGRNGFTSKGDGTLDGFRYLMKVYAERIAMLKSANASESKTKRVPTSYAMESKRIDQGRASDYWTTEHEMAARAFSAYVEDKIAEQGNRSDFLAYGSDNNLPQYRMFNVRPFPEGKERVAINEGFDKLFGELQTRESDRGTAMFSRRGQPFGELTRRTVREGKEVWNDGDIAMEQDGKDRVYKDIKLRNFKLADVVAAKALQDGTNTSERSPYIGKLTLGLNRETGAIEALYNIEVDHDIQKGGYGERVLRSVLAGMPADAKLAIKSILPDAAGFWEKMGTMPLETASALGYSDGYLTRSIYEEARGKANGTDAQGPGGGTRFGRGEAASGVARESAFNGHNGSDGRFGSTGSRDDALSERASETAPPSAGLSFADFRAGIASEFGEPTAKRLIESGVITPLSDKSKMPDHVVPFVRAGDTIFGFYDPVTDKTYAILSNLKREMLRGLVLHEVGTHYGFDRMLGPAKYNQVMQQMDRMHVSGNAAVREARAIATKEAVNDKQIAEETLAYLVQNQPKLGIVREIIAAIKAFLFREFGIGGAHLTTADITALAKAAVEHSAREPVFNSGQVQPAFSRAGADSTAESEPTPAERVPAWAEGFSKAQQDALRKAGVIFPDQTIKERVKSLTKDFGKRFVQGVLDQFAPLRELNQAAYMKARLSKATDGGVEALMLYGKPFLRDGALDVDAKDAGFLKTLQGLRNEHERFFAWVAGQRARELKAAGKENLLTDEDLSFLTTLNRPDDSWNGRHAAYVSALNDLRAYNKAVMDIAEQQGIIDGESRPLWESQFYVPFYRVMDDGVTGPTVKSGLVRQYAFKKLKGGTENLNDLLKNTLMNWSHLLSAAQKNAAAKASIEAAVKAEIATEVPDGTKDAVWFLDNGTKRSFLIDDPYVMDAISSIEQANFGPWMKPLSAVKRWLTLGVTANPAFKIRNLIRDSIAAIGQNEISYNVWNNVMDGWKSTAEGSQTRASLMAGGGMFRFGTMLEGDRAQHLKRLIESGVDEGTVLDSKEKVKAFFQKAWDSYQELGDRSENINRAALYDQMIAAGHDHLTASFLARDMLDFGMSGKWAAVRFLTQVVPFMNARLQGLYKLGRGVKENPVRASYVTGAIALASLALLMGYGDDDDWKKREDWDRDTYWWFKFGGIAFRIPKPFELGAIGTIAERTYELAFDKEMSGKRFTQRMADIVSQNFSMSPVPQLVKPLVDLYANQDSFSGRQIETMGMENLRKQDRYTANTTYAARLVGKLGIPDPLQLMQGRYEGISPAQADYLIRGYFGWLGTMVTTATDYGVRPLAGATAKPSMQLRDAFLAGNFVESLPTNQSRYVTDLYQQAQEIEQAYNSWRQAAKQGDTAKARDIFESERENIMKYRSVEAVKRVESKINARVHQIEISDASPETKRQLLDALAAQKDQVARRVTDAH